VLVEHRKLQGGSAVHSIFLDQGAFQRGLEGMTIEILQMPSDVKHRLGRVHVPIYERISLVIVWVLALADGLHAVNGSVLLFDR
jgi:hypothetical protein